MKDTKEIVLFLKENTTFSPTSIANELLNRYPELGESVILPENNNKKVPLIIFSTNPDMQIQVSKHSLNLVLNHVYFNKISSIVFDIVDTFETYNSGFNRIGYISNIFLAPKYVEKAKIKYLNMDNLKEIGDFNLSWYNKLDTKFGDINCWERVITDKLDFEDLLMQFDFNSPINEEVDFTMKYIKEFINSSNDYIEQRINI